MFPLPSFLSSPVSLCMDLVPAVLSQRCADFKKWLQVVADLPFDRQAPTGRRGTCRL